MALSILNVMFLIEYQKVWHCIAIKKSGHNISLIVVLPFNAVSVNRAESTLVSQRKQSLEKEYFSSEKSKEQ